MTTETDNPSWWEHAIARNKHPQAPVLKGNTVIQAVAEVTRRGSVNPRWGRFLFRLVHQLRPERCVELGASVGISGAYLAAGLTENGTGKLVTLEGIRDMARITREGLDQIVASDHVEVVHGQFEDHLTNVLSQLGGVDLAFIDGHHVYDATMDYFGEIAERTPPGGVLVFDDVVYSREEMERAWRDIRADPRVTWSVTIEKVGLAVVSGTPGTHTVLRGLPEVR